MKEPERLQYYGDRIKKSAQLEKEVDKACDFRLESEEVLQDDLDFLLEGGCRRNYSLLPFAEDGAGGVYVLVDDARVAHITSEGQAGYVAENVDDFYKVLLNCGYLSDFLSEEILSDADSFCAVYEEIKGDAEEMEALEAFLQEEGLLSEPEEIYELFWRGVSITPPFEIEPTDEDYEKSENLLGMDEEDFAEFIQG